jgi:hypothetical protein
MPSISWFCAAHEYIFLFPRIRVDAFLLYRRKLADRDQLLAISKIYVTPDIYDLQADPVLNTGAETDADFFKMCPKTDIQT